MSRTKRRLRNSRCEWITGTNICTGLAIGDVWPPKRIGEPMQASSRSCAAHLDAAQDLGWTVSRDAHVALMGE